MKKLFMHSMHDHKKTPWVAYLINGILVAIIFTLLMVFCFSKLDYTMRWDVVLDYKNNFISGFLTTLKISFFSLFASILWGTILAIMQKSPVIFLQLSSKFFVQIIRGTPLLVQILILFYVVANAFNINSRIISGIIIMAIFSGAYIAEIIRAGIESVSNTQIETAYAIGFTSYQKYRYIIIPQVITRIIPSLTGQLASLIKDSSLLSIISIRELTMASREIAANSYATLETYIPLAIGYLILTIPVVLFSHFLEKRYSYDT